MDTVNLLVAEEGAGLRFTHIQDVGLRGLVIRQHQVTPGLHLLCSRVAVRLQREERRKVVLPWPLDLLFGRHTSLN